MALEKAGLHQHAFDLFDILHNFKIAGYDAYISSRPLSLARLLTV